MAIDDNEDLPVIRSATELDETAEYVTNRSKGEDPLLTAQRYLNIYHQIHIFKDNKKKEFNASLMAMPDEIKDILPQLPGGRILLEHILSLETKAGMSDTYTQHLLELTQATNAHSSPYSAAKADHAGNNVSLSKDFAKDLAESLAVALKENNADKPVEDLGILLKQLILQTRPQGLRRVAIKNVAAREGGEDIDINEFLHNSSKDNAKPKTVINPRTHAPLEFKNQLSAADIQAAQAMSSAKDSAKSKVKASNNTYNEALQKIKSAIDPSSSVSLDNLDVQPVSLTPPDTQSYGNDEDWIYVDENGNPITDLSGSDEWEYVDENGNPIKL